MKPKEVKIKIKPKTNVPINPNDVDFNKAYDYLKDMFDDNYKDLFCKAHDAELSLQPHYLSDYAVMKVVVDENGSGTLQKIEYNYHNKIVNVSVIETYKGDYYEKEK